MYYFILHYILSYITLYICLACLTAGVAMFSQNPSVEAAGMPSLSAIRYRKRAESRLVPLPMTRCLGRPLSFQVTYVKNPLRGQKNWVLRANKRWNVWYCVFMGTWVGHDDEDAVGTVSDDLRDDVFEDVDVSLHQIQSALALLLTHACRHHHDTRVSRHRVIYRTNPDVQEVQTTEKPLKMSRVRITQWPSGGSDHMGGGGGGGGYCVNRAFF